jgi:hypothetical protein
VVRVPDAPPLPIRFSSFPFHIAMTGPHWAFSSTAVRTGLLLNVGVAWGGFKAINLDRVCRAGHMPQCPGSVLANFFLGWAPPTQKM